MEDDEPSDEEGYFGELVAEAYGIKDPNQRLYYWFQAYEVTVTN